LTSHGRMLLTGILLLTLTLGSASAAGTPSWSGRWRTVPVGLEGDPILVLVQKGDQVRGRFGWQYRAENPPTYPSCYTGAGGTLRGTVRGRNLTAAMVYSSSNGHPKAALVLRATISANGRAILGSGLWRSGECKGINFTLEGYKVGHK